MARSSETERPMAVRVSGDDGGLLYPYSGGLYVLTAAPRVYQEASLSHAQRTHMLSLRTLNVLCLSLLLSFRDHISRPMHRSVRFASSQSPLTAVHSYASVTLR